MVMNVFFWLLFIQYASVHLHILLLTNGQVQPPVRPVVRIHNGLVRGRRVRALNKDVDEFLGIPFAEPPVKELRFQRPVPKSPWKDIWNATSKPNSCFQITDETFGDFRGSIMWNANTNRSEDCLYLNVWVPVHPEPVDSAVMVWIYGGGFYSGTSTLDVYDGKILASQQNVIIVSMQYRVASLGFATLLTEEMPGNQGLFDQLLALDWVQNNIRFFGGNPRNVTLFGESAGAASVHLHLMSPLSRDKFQRAILQSATATAPWATISRENAKQRTLQLAERANCYQSGGATSLKAIADCMKSVDGPTTYNEGYDYVTFGHAQFPFVPIIDGEFIVQEPRLTVTNSSMHNKPILLGFNHDEGTFFLLYEMIAFAKEEIEKEHKFAKETLLQPDFGISNEYLRYWLGHVTHFYPDYPYSLSSIGKDAVVFQYTNWKDTSNRRENLIQLHRAAGDLNFVCDVARLAHMYALAGQSVYLYYFTQRSTVQPWPLWMGVLHGDEINFVFGEPLNRSRGYTDPEMKLSKKMMAFWSNFAKTGDPNRIPGDRSLGVWPIHTVQGKEHLELNAKFVDNPDASAAVGNAERSKNCAFWKEYLPHLLKITESITDLEAEWKQAMNDWKSIYMEGWKNEFAKFKKDDFC